MSLSLQCKVAVESGSQPLQALVNESGVDAGLLEDAAKKGAVWVSKGIESENSRVISRPHRLRTLSQAVNEDSTVLLNYDEAVLSQHPQTLELVADHVNYGIWNKPAGMLCQGSKWGDHTTATQVAAAIRGKKSYLVHRLDKAASGLLLIAYTNNATRKLSALFEQRKVNKRYELAVFGQFNLPLPHIVELPLDGKSAHTEILQAEYDQQSQHTALTVSIKTGRKHQIRRHLALSGFPIVGDRLYCNAEQHEHDLQLKACAISFVCPFTDKPVSVSLS